MQTIDISGKWYCTSPDGEVNKEVKLPGSSCENGIGKKQEYFKEYVKEAVRAPREKYEYIGKLTYEREIDIPAEFAGKNLCVFLERVNIASKLWFDGIQVGRGVVELSTPHIYRLSDRVNIKGEPLIKDFTGKHTLKIEVDNSNFLNLGDMASGYSVDTGGYWNGIIGRMEVISYPKDYIENVKVFTKEDGIGLETIIRSDRHVPMDIEKGSLEFEVTAPDGKVVKASKNIELFASRFTDHFFIHIDDIKKWDEFDKNLYSVKVVLRGDGFTDEYVTEFGFRDICVKDKSFYLNGEVLSLRGTINCAQYPLTGYPPMDKETWIKHFTAFKEYGLNHVRFHAWCPPEAAFEAADLLGLYLSIEMPLWLNRDIAPMEFGDDEWHELYFRTEALRISETYGNHPSFLFFSNGNENMGDFTLLETIIRETKAIDNRRLYTMTSNFDHPLSPYEDYLCAFEIFHKSARLQFLHDEAAKATDVNYDEMRAIVPTPFTSFEVGQYCVYPDVDLTDEYTGNMMAVNFDVIRKEMKKKGVYNKLHDYIKASGDLAAKLYKEDIEAVLRTKGMGGFQLLALTDYTGQSTATVGMLDIFHRDKGIISGSKWRRFCSEVVPLFIAKRIFKNTEVLEAQLSLYDHGKKKIDNPIFKLLMKCKGEKIFETLHEGEGEVKIPLSFIKENSLIEIELSVAEYTNTYRIFVFKDEDGELDESVIVRSSEELSKAVEAGRNVIALRSAFNETTYKNSFIPVFWSPVHFPSTDPCGAWLNENHKALKSFPTDKYIDYQWKELLENSVSFDITKRTDDDIIMEMVPNFVDNVPKSPLFETKIKGSRVLVCGFDLGREDLTAKALKESLIKYITEA